MSYWCYTCLGPRANCPPGAESGGCAKNEQLSEEYRLEKAAGLYDVPYFSPMPGGTTEMAKRADHERKFSRDMNEYREARRAGEQPDSTTAEGVRAARQRQETMDRAKAANDG